MWQQKCEKLLIHEDQQEAKDAEIRTLKAELVRQQLSHERVPRNSLTTVHSPTVIASDIIVPGTLHETAGRTYDSRVGKAPPLEPFVGEGQTCFLRNGSQVLKELPPGMAGVKLRS